MKLRSIAEQRPDLLTEAQLSGLVAEVARIGGFTLRYHTLRSKGSPSGFPDWVFVNPAKGRILFVELKSEVGKPTGKQQEWIDGLRAVSSGGVRCVEVYLWRPSDWPEIVRTLTGREPRKADAA